MHGAYATGRLIVLALAAACAFACSNGARGGAGVGEACAGQLDCAAPLVCAKGKCALPEGLGACIAGNRRCEGADLLECDALGLHETVVETCALGCASGQCNQGACIAGAKRCGAAGVEICSAGPLGTPSWQLAQACPAGCDAATSTCKALACRPLEVRCSASSAGVVETCAADGSGFVEQPCASGARCVEGACVALRCTAGASFCEGSKALRCSRDGTSIEASADCPLGCKDGACIAAACAAGATRCDGAVLSACKPDGSGYAPVRDCTASGGCVETAAGRASCIQPVCSPLARRCNSTSTGLEVCSGDGTFWMASDACSDGCSDGACLPPPGGCTDGQLRCAGSAVQKCEDGTRWTTVAQCLGGCSGGGVCSGGSCATGFAVKVPLPRCAVGGDCVPPADGASSLLAVAGPILDGAGNAVPDGTLVTVAAAGGAAVLSGDAQADAPGVQVRTRNGYADFSFRAPPRSALDPVSNLAYGTVTASVLRGEACAASATVPFGANDLVAYVAEDFTTDVAKDPAATTADWRNDVGAVVSARSEFGDGRDGALCVASTAQAATEACPKWQVATSFNLSTSGFAPAVRVVGVETSAVRVDGSVTGFGAGDEVLLIEPQGASPAAATAAGAWELLNIASVAEGRLTFTRPVAGTYGAKAGAALAGERVIVQRIPQFTNVEVRAGASLTTSAWDGTLGGILAFRASGTVTVAGAIHADAIGFRAGAVASPTQGQAGESYGGVAPVLASAARNLGGGSGGYLCGDPYHLNQLDSWYGSGGSYGDVEGSSTCAGSFGHGGAYGTPTLARLFFGSGSGSQVFNSHSTTCAAPSGSPQAGRCPSESFGSLPSKILPGVNCGAGASLDLNCVANACGGNAACIESFTVCKTESHSGNATWQRCYDRSCNDAVATSCGSDQNCINALTYCFSITSKWGAAELPCDASNNPACSNTFNSCWPWTAGHGDTPYPGGDCSTACPRLVKAAQADCYMCGCTAYGKWDCPSYTCDAGTYACFHECTGTDWGKSGSTTGFGGACNGAWQTCRQEGDCPSNQFCDNNCNIFGSNCDCHYMGFWCYQRNGPAGGYCDDSRFCKTCDTCRGCQTNPGCQYNQGCTIAIASPTAGSPACQTCGGLIAGQDGTRCDVTNPNNTCRCPLPWQSTASGGRGGGILFVAAAKLDLAATGRVSAKGADPAGVALDGSAAYAGGAGGSLWLRVGTMVLKSGAKLSAQGGTRGGTGRVRLERGGGDDPEALAAVIPSPYKADFNFPTAQSRPMLPAALAAKKVVSAWLVNALELPAESYAVQSNTAVSWQPVAPGGSVTFPAASDVRWRAQLTAPGSGRIDGVTWLLRLQ